MRNTYKSGLGLAIVLLAGAASVPAKAIPTIISPDSITASNQSYIRDNGTSPIGDAIPDTTKSYFAGTISGQGNRDFFIFDVPNLPGQTLTGATLDINQWNSSGTPLDYTLWDVTTPISTLTGLTDAGSAAGLAAYNDLGSGVQYGSTVLNAANDNTLLHISLNTAAINGLTAAEGGQFAIGGAIDQPIFDCATVSSCTDGIQPADGPTYFAYSVNNGSNQGLTLTFSPNTPVVPESSSLLNMAGGLLGIGLGALLLRRKSAKA